MVGLRISNRPPPIPGFLQEAGSAAQSPKCALLTLVISNGAPTEAVSNGAPTEAGFLSGCGVEGPLWVSPERGEPAGGAGDKEREGEGKRRTAPWQRKFSGRFRKAVPGWKERGPPAQRSLCVGRGAGVDRGREVAPPRVSAAAGGKVWPASRCPSLKTQGNFVSQPLTLFLRRNKVDLLRHSIPLAIQFFLPSH